MSQARLPDDTALEFLQRAGALLTQNKAYGDRLYDLAQEICRQIGFVGVAVDTYDPSAARPFIRLTYPKLSDEVLAETTASATPQAVNEFIALMLAQRRPLIVADPGLQASTTPKMREYFLDAGVHTIAAFPLIHQDEMVGTLWCSSRDAPDVAQAPFDLVQVLTPYLATFVRSAFNEARAIIAHERVASANEELAQASHALTESEARFRSLVQNASDMIMVVDADGVPTYASPSVERIMGHPREDWLGTNILSFVHPDDVQRASQSLAAVLGQAGIHPPAELRIRHRDGSWRTVELIANNLLDDAAVRGVVYNARDITERREAETALLESEDRFRGLAENSPVGIYQMTADRQTLYLNRAALDLFEADDSGAVAKLGHETFFDGDSLATMEAEQAKRTSGVASTYEVALTGLRGTRRNVLVSGAPLLSDDGRLSSIVGTITDITERKRGEEALRQSEARFKALVQNASDLVTVIEADTTITYQSPSILQVLGHQAESIVGTQLSAVVHAEDRVRLYTFLNEAIGRRDTPSVELRLQHGDGSWHDVEIVATDQRSDPAVGGFVLNSRDISDRKSLEEQLRHQAFHDPLTRLANRARFMDRLELALLRARRSQSNVAVLFMDLDNFKNVNDGLGHTVGDQLLVEVATRLEPRLRPGDTVARFGGDEFVILLEDVSTEDASHLARRLTDALRVPFACAGKELFVSASVGIAVTTPGEVNADDMLRNADVAMYMAKAHGKARCEVYEESMHTALVERLELLSDLQRAIDRQEFVVHYQPTVNLRSGEIVGVEALVRWRHPTRGLLLPADFIPLAEESGAIVPLGTWVLREACTRGREWQQRYASEQPLTISVNISVRQLQQPDFVSEVAEILGESGLDPATLVLEVTESVMMQDVESTVRLLRSLKSLGLRLAIDDFGTGYSSLSYLSRFPFDVLKIDKLFVDETQGEKELTRAIIDLGKMLEMEIVAEGIERVDQLARLRSLDCDTGQGYYFARPLAAEEIDRLLGEAADHSQVA